MITPHRTHRPDHQDHPAPPPNLPLQRQLRTSRWTRTTHTPCHCSTRKKSSGGTEPDARYHKHHPESPRGQPACPVAVVAAQEGAVDHPRSRRLSRTGGPPVYRPTTMTTYRHRHTSRSSAARLKRRCGGNTRECRLLVPHDPRPKRTITRMVVVLIGSSTIRARGRDDRNNSGLPRVGRPRNVRIRGIVLLCDYVSVIHCTAI